MMGRKEADLDGIKYYYDPNACARGHHGCIVYLVPCDICGRKVKRVKYVRNGKTVCDICKVGVKKKKDEIAKAWLDEIETKGERRFNQALDELQAQVKDFSEYEKAITIARRGTERYGSIPEVLVAIELLRLGYKFIPQQKVGRYRVDFYIPDDKFVIEVDGSVYHRNVTKGDREATIQFSLGLDVKIIHIPAELIRKDIRKLGKYIEKSLQIP